MKTIVDHNGMAWLVLHGDQQTQSKILAAPVNKTRRAMWLLLAMQVCGIFLLGSSILLLGSNHASFSGIATMGGIFLVVLAAKGVQFRRASGLGVTQFIPTTIILKLHVLLSACALALLIGQIVLIVAGVAQW